MKLSNETVGILKNFSTINKTITLKKGSTLSTIADSKAVLARAVLKDEFPQDFNIHDLNQFLQVHGLFDKADLEFDSEKVVFKSGPNKSIKYRMSSPDQVVPTPNKIPVLPTEDSKFTLSAEYFEWLMKTARVLNNPHVTIKSDGENVEIESCDIKDPSQHSNTIRLGDGDGKKFSLVFSTDNFKMIPGTYEVTVSFKGIAHFSNAKDSIEYWIAFEPKYSNVGE
jgi:hypothetical protein